MQYLSTAHCKQCAASGVNDLFDQFLSHLLDGGSIQKKIDSILLMSLDNDARGRAIREVRNK
ncbi:hypothetical protein C7W93_13140 [Glaciimonas sp. PCH181]|nr:hypothetical protein C7W93_13140 [Glaciimonas sp. PCH181]